MESKEKTKPKTNRDKEIIKIKMEINETEKIIKSKLVF